MGAVDETRKLVQDFLTPELREIKARLDALEQTVKIRFEAVDARFAAQDQMAAARHTAVMEALNHLTHYAALSEHLPRLEAQKEQKAS